MRRSFGLARGFFAFLVVSTAACASSGTAQSGGVAPRLSERDQALAYWQQLRDSATAQAIADEEGPRVTVRASYASFTGSRHIRADFTLKDDAYVLIGQLDAAGRLSIIFPESPDDDGFLRGGKSYNTPERFAGFEDQYLDRYASNRAFMGNNRARVDSYDRGAGYLFIVASWRPMRFDRIADGARFTSYELNESEVNDDPRPAIAELAALIAGDNREAYTLEFANYYRSTPIAGAGFASAFRSNCYNSSAYGYGSAFYPSFSRYYGYGYGPSFYGGSSCGGLAGYGYSYVPGPVGVTPTPTTGIGRRAIVAPRSPFTPMGAERPRAPLQRNEGDSRATQPVRPIISADAATGPRAGGLGSPRSYRDRGLLTSDDGDIARPRASQSMPRAFDQPSISDMVGRRRLEAGSGRVMDPQYERPRNAREFVGRPNGDFPSGRTTRGTEAGMNTSREMARSAREGERTHTPSSDSPRHAAPAESRRSDPPSRVESPRPSAPAAAPRAEPVRTATPAAERPTPRSEGGSKPTPNP